jgi:hypothetical protein
MAEINSAQLSFETFKRELTHSDIPRKPRGIIEGELRTTEHYLNEEVIGRWQNHGGSAWAGANAELLTDLKLKEFIGGPHDGYFDFERHVSTPLDHIALVLLSLLFGEPTLRDVERQFNSGERKRTDGK